MTTSSSYNTSSWGQDCFMLGEKADQPCWGRVEMVDDGEFTDMFGIHHETGQVFACEGHFNIFGHYTPEGGGINAVQVDTRKADQGAQ